MKSKSQKFVIAAALLVITALSLAACGGGDTSGDSGGERQPVAGPSSGGSSGDLTGKEVFSGLCSACHGPNAEGIEGLGKNLHESEFFAERTDEDLVAFIIEGRPATHPDNTTGVDMPPRGGNPALTDEEILAVVLYLRELVGE